MQTTFSITTRLAYHHHLIVCCIGSKRIVSNDTNKECLKELMIICVFDGETTSSNNNINMMKNIFILSAICFDGGHALTSARSGGGIEKLIQQLHDITLAAQRSFMQEHAGEKGSGVLFEQAKLCMSMAQIIEEARAQYEHKSATPDQIDAHAILALCKAIVDIRTANPPGSFAMYVEESMKTLTDKLILKVQISITHIIQFVQLHQ